MKWFLSYVYAVPCPGGSNGERHVCHGCQTYEGQEHPVARVARWNEELKGLRVFVLVWFAELEPAAELPVLESEIG